MIPLPKELQPWRDALALFPDELVGEVGGLLRPLALVVGPARAWRFEEGGEPDGFAGIGRRGSYERLLLTEWLLADEAPDEFARRAAMGEHAFFQIARRTPARAATSAAIFDAGPDQLGAARVAHLAALIVLAARAERAGARFAWGLLGDPDGALSPAVTKASVGRLLAARTAVPSSPDDVAAWAARAARSGWEDAWLVGGPDVAKRWPHASLAVEDVLDQPDESPRRLAITARSPRGLAITARSAELVLPPPAACVRLLRDPFAIAAAPRGGPWRSRAAPTPASNLVFAMNGAKLFARGRDGEILAYAVPASASDPLSAPKRYRAKAGAVVAAVGWVKRGLVMVTVTPSRILLEHTVSRGPDLLDRKIALDAELRIAIPTDADPLSVLGYQEDASESTGRAARPPMAVFLDARRALVRIRASVSSGPHVSIVASEVAALACSSNAITFVGRGTRPVTEPESSAGGLGAAAPHREGSGPPEPESSAGGLGGAAPHREGSGPPEPESSAGGLGGAAPHREGSGPPKPEEATVHLDADDPLDVDWHHVVAPAHERMGHAERLPGDGSFEAVLGHEVAAVQQGGGAWVILTRKGKPRPRLTPPAGTRVVSVWQGPDDGKPELVLLEADRRTLSFLGRSTARTLVGSSSPIVDVATNPWREQIAFATTEGEVVIVNLRGGVVLARYTP